MSVLHSEVAEAFSLNSFLAGFGLLRSERLPVHTDFDSVEVQIFLLLRNGK